MSQLPRSLTCQFITSHPSVLQFRRKVHAGLSPCALLAVRCQECCLFVVDVSPRVASCVLFRREDCGSFIHWPSGSCSCRSGGRELLQPNGCLRRHRCENCDQWLATYNSGNLQTITICCCNGALDYLRRRF